MRADHDQLANWLLGSIELDTAVFHVGQYCGRWRASTAGRALGSFHLVLQGHCYLHLPGQAPIALGPRDGVFLLRDIEHFVSPDSDPLAHVTPQAMRALDTAAQASAGLDNPPGTGLACGFFQLRGALSALIADSFPDYLIIRADTPDLHAAGTLFDLILAEAGGDPEQPSPLVARLVELIFFYVVRHVSRQQQVATGLAALLRRGEFTPLFERMLQAPADDWSIDSMAKVAHMSRASFCKHFADASGHPPAQFLLLLRMKIASQRLHAGDSVERTAEHVGYRSHAAFTRAFKRVTGEQPGAYRRRQLLIRDARTRKFDARACRRTAGSAIMQACSST